ncbi:MAG: dTDP-4-dehydrorhamnose reductase [Candidatus Theseobacter exili]|nr:dTDP-4-dehydrorhamnose reductase [Candidatus Theseobacter exili]
MKKVLITGAEGMLGKELAIALESCFKVYLTDVDQLDITDLADVLSYIEDLRPEIIINLAAYTDVDECEDNLELTFLVNSKGPENLAEAAVKNDAYLVHISTDYVFDGKKKEPYSEDDIPSPISVYGESKRRAEATISKVFNKAGSEKFLIARSSWLFGPGGKNFITSIINKSNKEKKLSIVDDQIGKPTYTVDLSNALKALIIKEVTGIINVSNSGKASWYTLSKEVMRMLGIDIEICPLKTSDSNRKARRPLNSVLDDKLFFQIMGYRLRTWQEALTEYLEKEEVKKLIHL